VTKQLPVASSQFPATEEEARAQGYTFAYRMTCLVCGKRIRFFKTPKGNFIPIHPKKFGNYPFNYRGGTIMVNETLQRKESSEKRRQESNAVLERRCHNWNSGHSVGSEVEYHPVIGEEAHRITKTRSEAYVLSGHTAVIFVEGQSGCVALEAVRSR
jgi:hypothetical protein